MIKPKGYTYELPNQNDCFIGVSEIPDSYNQYRLGTIFLRNFYTGLDYNTQEIMLGINEGTDSASMIGKSMSKEKKSQQGTHSNSLVFISFFLLTLMVIAMVCYCKNKK